MHLGSPDNKCPTAKIERIVNRNRQKVDEGKDGFADEFSIVTRIPRLFCSQKSRNSSLNLNRSSSPSISTACSINGHNPAYGVSDPPNDEGSKERNESSQGGSLSSNVILRKLKRYGISGILSYGLLNTAYYLSTFLLVWFYVAPVPGRMGYLAAVERFLKVMAMVWAGSQVTKLIRAGGALALAPFVDRGLSWFTLKFKFESQGKQQIHQLLTQPSQKLKLEENNLRRPQAVLAFLKSHGFDNTHIAELIKKRPRILQSKVEDNLKPKIEFLTQNGFVGKLLADLIVLNPVIFRVLVSMKESNWNRKMEVLKSFGWSEEAIWSVFKSNPLCLGCSEEKMKSAMDFCVNTMEMDVETIIRYPRFLTYAVDNRLRPRYNVLKVLKSKNLLKEGKNYASLANQAENTLYKNYVVKHSDSIPGLMELYRGITMAENKDS
ncbi:hypothetical protein SO802_008827 [Lithocarpus litseifolius]|uniref:Uncharacterized protein n=1 Tax=Lithocarpus litseifolius TaxID=425828 RepID=A0AAW2DDK5_9ROSI